MECFNRLMRMKIPKNQTRSEHSYLKIALLCIAVCFANQIVVSLLPVSYVGTLISKSPVTSSSPKSLAPSSSTSPITITVTSMSGSPPSQHLPFISLSELHAGQHIDAQYKAPASTPTANLLGNGDSEVCE